MCGLAGYLNLTRTHDNVDEALLHAMQHTMVHRGPNGFRTWISHEHQLGLVHRRLSIVDLSDAGFQPMLDQDRRVVVCCNGEIYNHAALRQELESLGHSYYSQSDSETILYAYKQWGIDFLHRLEGMFSIVLFDIQRNELYVIRDRFGIKPLYFSLQGNILSFASEIKALWPLPWIHKTINTTALYHYLTYLVTPAPLTLYQGVYKVPAGYFIKVDAYRTVTFHEWYNPVRAVIGQPMITDEVEAVETLRVLLRDSIKKHMMSDVPYGVFLSGGIDSSLNVALMSELTDRVKTFTVSFSDGPEYSEVGWARKVAQQFATHHHEIVISEKDAFAFFNDMVHYQDEPIADCVCIPLYYVSKLLKDSGVTVVQVGEGSDELFCGYSTYGRYIDIYNTYWGPSQKYIPGVVKKTMYQAATRLLGGKQPYSDILKNWSGERHLFWSGATAFFEWQKKDFVPESPVLYDPLLQEIYPGFGQQRDSYAVVEYHLQKFRALKPDADFFEAMMYLELKHRLPELLLTRVDKMTMATSVEGRVPFLDHHFVEYALRISPTLKYKDGVTKYILKKAAEGILPHEIIYRKKMGFAAPTKRWFKEGSYFKPYFQDMLQTKKSMWSEYINFDQVDMLFASNQKENREYSVQLWALQNLIANDV